jgi:N4-gp56 family major capsid protein
MAGQVWATNSLGGYMYSLNLSKKLRHAVQPTIRFRQFCDIKDAVQQGKSKGDTFHWNVYSNVATQGTTLTETTTMPETQFTITQGTLTITEYGNSVPYSGKLDDLSEHPVTQIINKVIKHDASKAFDIAAHAQMNTSLLRLGPSGGTSTTSVELSTNGTASSTASVAFNNDHAKAVIDTLKERNVPAYTDDDYYALTWPSTIRTFKNNLEDIHQYTSEGFRMIARGEIGRYENCRYVEQTNIAKGGYTYTDWMFFMGEDTVAEAIACPEEMRGKIPSDYGRSKGIAWYYLGGFGIVHAGTGGDHVQGRIFKWDSLA